MHKPRALCEKQPKATCFLLKADNIARNLPSRAGCAIFRFAQDSSPSKCNGHSLRAYLLSTDSNQSFLSQ